MTICGSVSRAQADEPCNPKSLLEKNNLLAAVGGQSSETSRKVDVFGSCIGYSHDREGGPTVLFWYRKGAARACQVRFIDLARDGKRLGEDDAFIRDQQALRAFLLNEGEGGFSCVARFYHRTSGDVVAMSDGDRSSWWFKGDARRNVQMTISQLDLPERVEEISALLFGTDVIDYELLGDRGAIWSDAKAGGTKFFASFARPTVRLRICMKDGVDKYKALGLEVEMVPNAGNEKELLRQLVSTTHDSTDPAAYVFACK